jgi:hypothetical protein
MLINSSNRTKARLMVFSYVTVGVLIGVGLMNFIAATTAVTPSFTRPSMVDRLNKDLKFTPDQKIQAEKISAEHREKSREIFKAVKPQMDELMISTREKMKSVLSPEQIVKFEEINKKRDAERTKDNQPPAK